jgi:transposase
MLGIPPSVRIFVCKDPVDMRCGRYRLAAKMKQELKAVQIPLGLNLPETPVTKQEIITVPAHPRKKTSKKAAFPNNAGASGLRFDDTVEIGIVTCVNPVLEGLSAQDYEVIGTETVDKLCQRRAAHYVKRFIREKVKVKETKQITIAPPPASVIPGSFLDNTFLTGLIVDKILNHFPLYRAYQRLKEGGVYISRSTLTNGFHSVGDLIQPVFQAHLEHILTSNILTMDETGVKVGVNHEKHAMDTGFFWALYGDSDEVAFLSYDSRKHEVVDKIIKDKFSGTLLTDDYAAYKSYAGRIDSVIHALCWSHSRRYFVDAEPVEPKKVAQILSMIGELYAIEGQIREKNITGGKKLAHRAEYSRPIVDKIFDWHKLQRDDFLSLPKSPFTKGVLYVLDNEKELREFLNNPDLPLDTNHIERANKHVAIGKNNWLFCTSEIGAEYVAMFHSLLITARLHNINPYDYLLDILPRIQSCPTEGLYSLTPLGWKKARMAAA